MSGEGGIEGRRTDERRCGKPLSCFEKHSITSKSPRESRAHSFTPKHPYLHSPTQTHGPDPGSQIHRITRPNPPTDLIRFLQHIGKCGGNASRHIVLCHLGRGPTAQRQRQGADDCERAQGFEWVAQMRERNQHEGNKGW
jgi:hypothetical protein